MENSIRWFEETQLGCIETENTDCLQLEIEGNNCRFTFRVKAEGQERQIVAQDVDGSFLGSETSGGFVGTYLGMFATGNGIESSNEAAFADFAYYPLLCDAEN